RTGGSRTPPAAGGRTSSNSSCTEGRNRMPVTCGPLFTLAIRRSPNCWRGMEPLSAVKEPGSLGDSAEPLYAPLHLSNNTPDDHAAKDAERRYSYEDCIGR